MRSAALVTTRQLTEELRLREALLKESEFRWKYAIEGSGDGLWDMDVEQSTLFYSDAFQRLLGFLITIWAIILTTGYSGFIPMILMRSEQ